MAWCSVLLDYNCGDRTYDTTSGNHRGTDIELWPLPWRKVERNQVEVVAAAAGTIVCRQDGYPDNNCCNGSTWNVICVRHSDGSTAWYGHLKRNSLTSKGVGASVAAGEYLGVVGNSGCSVIPHLHLQVFDVVNDLLDPFHGPCNSTNPDSMWLDQPPYNDSAVNAIMVSSSPPEVLSGCPGTETTYEETHFGYEERVYFSIYFRNILAGQIATFVIRRPDLSIDSQWTKDLLPHAEYQSRLELRELFWIHGTPEPPSGEWRFDVHFNGDVYSRSFYVDIPAPTAAGRLGPELRLGPPTLDGLPLTWAPSSCNPADSLYAVFTGLIGNWNNHGFVTCAVAGTSFDVPLQVVSGNRYYLVAPRSATAVGSYGLDSNGEERPTAVNNCDRPQVISCPGEE